MAFFKGRRILHYNLQKRRVAHVAPLFLATFAALFFGCAPRSHGEPSGSIFGPSLRPTSMRTIEFFRRCPSTRPAKGRPSVYTALCARIEVRPLRARLENHPKITPRGLPERAVRRIVDFFAPGGDSASNLVVSRPLRALPGTLFGSPGRPWPEPARRPGGLERPRIDPSCLDWPPRPTKSTQHRSKRPLDRPKSTEDRPKRPPRDDSGRFSSDLGSVWVMIFEVFRRCASTRPAKGRP